MLPRLLDEIAEVGGQGTMVSYMGGEPLLSRSLLAWLEQATRLKLDFRFTSNGYLITREMARKLVATELFNIGVSLESLDPNINEQIRPIPNGTRKTIDAIEFLLLEKQRQRARLSINVKCTLTALNLGSIVGIVERWGKQDGVLITPQMFEAQEGMPFDTKKRLWSTDVRKIEATIQRLKELKAEGYNINADEQALDNFVRLYREDPDGKSTMHNKTVAMDESQPDCNIGTDNLFILHGQVHLCPYFPPIGEVLEGKTTLAQIWRGNDAKRMRADIRKCRKLCTVSCLRQTSLLHKIKTFLKM